MLILGLFSKLMIAVGVFSFVYGWFKQDKIIKVVSLIILASGILFWAIKATVSITFLLVVIALLIAGAVYAFKKYPD